MQAIKITYTDGNEVVTRINGTHDEITNYYAQSNEYALEFHMPQAKRIEFLGACADYSSKVYLFIDYAGNGLLS